MNREVYGINFSVAFFAMIKLFLILMVGYGCHKGGVFPEGTQQVLTKLVLLVTTPCNILYSVLSSNATPSWKTLLFLFLLSCLAYCIMIPLSLGVGALLKVPKEQRGVFSAMMTFGNAGFIGYPVVATIFGSSAVFLTAVHNIPFYLFLYTVGIILLAKDGARRGNWEGKLKIRPSAFFSPCVLASLLSLTFAMTGLRLPDVVTETIGMVANITTPSALLVIGIFIAKLPLKSMLGSVRLYLMTGFRLIVQPVLLWLIFRLLTKDPMILGIALTIASMPSATMVTMLSAEYGADADLSVQGIFLTTLFSVVTIPLVLSVLI